MKERSFEIQIGRRKRREKGDQNFRFRKRIKIEKVVDECEKGKRKREKLISKSNQIAKSGISGRKVFKSSKSDAKQETGYRETAKLAPALLYSVTMGQSDRIQVRSRVKIKPAVATIKPLLVTLITKGDSSGRDSSWLGRRNENRCRPLFRELSFSFPSFFHRVD